jgi:GNAT superfamily N-acetyltransferase
VPLTEVHPTGREYLRLATHLLQDARLAEPRGGVWEAADLQWWWRVDQHNDPRWQCFWLDGPNPVVAASFTRWRDGFGCDLLGTDADVAEHADLLWAFVQAAPIATPVEMMIRDDDGSRITAAEAAGFHPADEHGVTAWLDAGLRPRVPSLPGGYTLAPFTGCAHPMAGRNGAEVAARLRECDRYRPDLDLAIRDDDGRVAAYALFWPDQVTGVGLVEPMRVEAEHQGRGLARALLAAGLDRLAATGCTRLKVSFDPANEPAARLYTGAGFRPTSYTRIFLRS